MAFNFFKKKDLSMLRTEVGFLEQHQALLTSDQPPQPLVLFKAILLGLVFNKLIQLVVTRYALK